MSNITRRNADPVFATISPLAGDWDPFRMMDSLLRWEPTTARRTQATFAPRFDVHETKDGYVFKADLPGVKEADLDIALTGNQLTVSGKREYEDREQAETHFVYERGFGGFSRSFALPSGADFEHIRAELKEGVLTLVVPKKPEVQPRKISIGSAAKAQT
jgi:HSP20 family protein